MERAAAACRGGGVFDFDSTPQSTFREEKNMERSTEFSQPTFFPPAVATMASSSTAAASSLSHSAQRLRLHARAAHRLQARRSESRPSSRPAASIRVVCPPRSASIMPPPLLRPSVAAAAAAAAASSSPSSTTNTLSASELAHLADVAAACADAAAQVTLRHFRSPSLAVDSKSDASPVTVADRAAEAAVRQVLSARVPAHAVFGEEGGMTLGDNPDAGSEFLWVVDPIDGTKSFISGKPLWGTLVALLHKGEPVLGLIDQPVLRERWLGVKGAQTTFNGKETSTRGCASLREAYLYATTPHMFAPGKIEQAWYRVRDAARIPLYGCDCYAYGLLALGHADVVVEADLGPYDYLAIAPVVAGAGGKMTDWRGRELRANYDAVRRRHSVEGLAREVVAAGDARVHGEALEKLGWK